MIKNNTKKILSTFMTFSVVFSNQNILPDQFVYLDDFIPNVFIELRYNSSFNFLGKNVEGYKKNRCIVTKDMAEALKKVQNELQYMGLGLKIYDAYRPQIAVDHFLRWANDESDTLTKKEFYPTLTKKELLENVYIATKSSHSRGSAIDLTIISLPPNEQEPFNAENQRDCSEGNFGLQRDNSLDMGSGYDCFHKISHTHSMIVTAQQRANRLLLKSLMERHGFKNYYKEWWHYNFIDETFPKTYFNFPVD
tara:strand:- start:435 stop:1187 length:753 start_codon:yes stop_codon:yes gene_type:complete